QNSALLKKLGMDSSDQWIIYNEQFEKFFNFLSESISDANILSEREVLESNELKRRGEWLDEEERKLRLQQIESENPGLLSYTAQDVDALEAEMVALRQATDELFAMVEHMQTTKHSLNHRQIELEAAAGPLHSAERDVLIDCQNMARKVEELQRENCRLSEEAKRFFTAPQAPPLFMHQQPLEQYFLKCDTFMQYFRLYMRDNFKLQEYSELELSRLDVQDINSKLENWQSSIQYYTLAHIKEKAKAKATLTLIQQTDVQQIHSISLADLVRETQELRLLNENHLKNTCDTLLHALTLHVQQHVQQRIELVLYENTKQKLERALQRRANDKQLTRIISDALSNAELIWIAIQLDLEKKRNCADSTLRLSGPAQASCRRVQAMRTLAASPKGICAQFVHEIGGLLAPHLAPSHARGQEVKTCLYEYEKFGRLLAYALQGMFNRKSLLHVHAQLAELRSVEQTLRPFVYDSPLEQPLFTNVRYLCPMFHAAQQQARFEEALRELRTRYREVIMQPMEQNTLWRYSKLLWIWFLCEPQRMEQAIEEVKKSSAKMSALSSAMFRPGGGLQRK
ncbi:hypothetical protein KR222_004474, partial [Zaprionus bogoriensis]